MQHSVFSIRSQFKMKNIFFIVLLTTLLCTNFSFAQYEIPKTPDFQTSVYDYYNLLSASQKKNLEDKLV